MDALERERQGCLQQSTVFYGYAREAPNLDAHNAWLAAAGQMEIASACLVPEGVAKYRSNAALFVRAARHAERPSEKRPEREAEERQLRQAKEAARILANQKRERTRYERLKKKFEG